MLVRQISEWPIQFCVIARSGSAARISSQGSVAANGSPPSTSATLDFYIKFCNLYSSGRREASDIYCQLIYSPFYIKKNRLEFIAE